MSTANNSSKLEQAAVAYLTALGTITADMATITTGKSSVDKSAPIVICEAEDGPEDMEGTGNYWLSFTAIIKTPAAIDADGVAVKPEDETLIGIVFDAFQVDDLAVQLSAALADFTCLIVKEFTQESGQNGDAWVNTIGFKALCAGSDM